MKFLIFLLQVILCTFPVTPKLHTISYSSKSEEVSNYTKNTLNDTSDNNGKPIDDVLRTLATKNTPTDEDDDLITANENPEEQIKSTTNTLPSSVPSSSSSASSSILCSSGLNDSREYNDALWPLLWLTDQQRPMRRKLEKLHYPTTSFSSINERSKFNELKVLGSTASITTELKEDEDDDDDMSIAGSDVRPQSIEIYTNTTANPMRNGTNVVAASDNPNHASDRVRLQAPNDNSPRQRQSQQVNHLKFYKSNSLFPLSFGQLPQSLKEPKYPKQKQQLSSPQVHHTDSAPHTKDEDAAVDDDDDDDDETAVDDVLQHHQHPFADYRLLFNAERYTEFYLDTLTKPHEITQKISLMGTRTRHEDATSTRTSFTAHYPLNASMAHDGGRVLNIVSDTIGAVFGVNVPPVASMQGIHLEPLQLYNSRSLRQSRFNPFNPTRILIHGWLGGSTAGLYNTLIPELLKLDNGSYNVITVDWGKGAIADYITASYRVKPVGKIVAKFIDFLHKESGIRFEDIALIGFSMGAHVAGIAGKYVQTGRLSRIYALDPAFPLFPYENIKERVDRTDAEYVEVLHTSVGSYGYDRPLGHVDFYVNFGSSQPGCYFKECSHFRAFQIFSQSLWQEQLEGFGCSPEMWQDMIRFKRCPKETGVKLTMTPEMVNLTALKTRRGVYYLLTNSQPPYEL